MNQYIAPIPAQLQLTIASQAVALEVEEHVIVWHDTRAMARIIEASGLKGYQIGGAQVSPKHANFIVNVGECTALDIELLIRHIKDVVLEKQGVALQQEVKVIGEYA